MSTLIAARERFINDIKPVISKSWDVKPGVSIFEGGFVFVDPADGLATTGTLLPTGIFVGVCTETFIANAAPQIGVDQVSVDLKQWERFLFPGVGFLNLGKICTAVDDDTVQQPALLVPAINTLGIIRGYETGLVIVELGTMGAGT